MNDVHVRERRPSPAARPFGLAFHRGLLWVGSWDTDSVYAIDPATWTVRETHVAPGRPYGIVSSGDALRVIVGFGGDDDDRYFYRLVPGEGFDPGSKTALPDLTGAYLTADGRSLYLGQMHLRRILALDAHDKTQREIALPARCAGIGATNSRFYMIAGDDELENLQFGTLDAAAALPAFAPIAGISDAARYLVHDGTAWWTSYRDENEIVAFTV